ncbi:unnamed protein product, partial [Prunus brigantina]
MAKWVVSDKTSYSFINTSNADNDDDYDDGPLRQGVVGYGGSEVWEMVDGLGMVGKMGLH